MAFVFYVGINLVTTELFKNYVVPGIDPRNVTVYEGMLLWSNKYISCGLTMLFTLLALLNVPFSTFIGFEQVMMLLREFFYKSESIRVQKYVTLKNRTTTEFCTSKPELKRQDYSKEARYIIISLILLLNIGLCYTASVQLLI